VYVGVVSASAGALANVALVVRLTTLEVVFAELVVFVDNS
jgi:hypothetical protein